MNLLSAIFYALLAGLLVGCAGTPPGQRLEAPPLDVAVTRESTAIVPTKSAALSRDAATVQGTNLIVAFTPGDCLNFKVWATTDFIAWKPVWEARYDRPAPPGEERLLTARLTNRPFEGEFYRVEAWP